ncbi:MAG: hypothetical protein KAS64_03850 [Spirochaetes bacterium]|nr:hypothetical protein [Spirochaetota bacterium]
MLFQLRKITLSILLVFIFGSIIFAEDGVQNQKSKGEWFNRISLNLDAVTLLQYNGTDTSKMSPLTARIRLKTEFRFSDSVSLILGTVNVGGRNSLHGVTGAFVPINDIAYTSGEQPGIITALLVDKAYMRLDSGIFSLSIGLMDLDSFDRDGSGIMNNGVILDEMYSFISAHFTRMLALNFMEKELSEPSVQAFMMTFRFTDFLTFRAGMTFASGGYHVFIRNTGPFEFDFTHYLFGFKNQIKIVFGLSDADKSGVHLLSPSAGVTLNQRFTKNLRLFSSFSHAEKKNYVSQLFGTFLWHFNAGFTFASGNGDVKTSPHYIGIGFSTAKKYDYDVTEKALELFWRFSITGSIYLTPSFLVIKNPSGTTESGKDWAYLPAIKGTMFF